jgi:hypothetical protein
MPVSPRGSSTREAEDNTHRDGYSGLPIQGAMKTCEWGTSRNAGELLLLRTTLWSIDTMHHRIQRLLLGPRGGRGKPWLCFLPTSQYLAIHRMEIQALSNSPKP